MVERGTNSTAYRRRITAVLGAAFLCGCLLGCVFSVCLAGPQTDEISAYLSSYLSLAQRGSVPRSFGITFWYHISWLILCVLVGLSVFGIICLPLFFMLRGFLIAFMAGCFIRFLGLGGVAAAVLVSGLSACAWLPGMIILSVGILSPIVRRLAVKSGDRQFFPRPGRECFSSLAYAFLLTLLCAYLEYVLIPALLPAVSRMIGL